jgi:hypothetical protein
MVNQSISISFEVAQWLELFARENKLFSNGKPSIGKAASVKLQKMYEQEIKK